MEKLTSKKAYEILTKDVINDVDDLVKPENKWVHHCIFVSLAAERIARYLNLDSDYAKSLALIHDIGRKISHPNHVIEGYNYMVNEGYIEEASICLTHSFIDNEILMTAGGGPETKEAYEYIADYLNKREVTIYDNIVQLCDLFCLETGFTTIENRLLDISKRKGIYPNSYDHVNKAMELKERIESMLGCNLYDIFPEIKKEDLENIQRHNEELFKLVKHPTKQLIKI
ncbi:MAG: HDIG domain-containing protein [Firmicutes bacterium]|nr:HDIG domain-containing protein [Bacillota bacterium]